MMDLNSTQFLIDWTEFKNIVYFTNERYSIIHFSVSSGDAINGYGRSELYSVRIDTYMEICNRCGRSPFYEKDWYASNGDCVNNLIRHSWDKKYQPLRFSSSKLNFQDALKKLDKELFELRSRI